MFHYLEKSYLVFKYLNKKQYYSPIYISISASRRRFRSFIYTIILYLYITLRNDKNNIDPNIKEINLLISDKDTLRNLNKNYRNKDSDGGVLSFVDKNNNIVDIIISIDRVALVSYDNNTNFYYNLLLFVEHSIDSIKII